MHYTLTEKQPTKTYATVRNFDQLHLGIVIIKALLDNSGKCKYRGTEERGSFFFLGLSYFIELLFFAGRLQEVCSALVRI